MQAGDEFRPHLPIAQISEQATGEQQIHRDPGGQQPDPLLGSPGRGEGFIDHLERNETGEFAEMTRREPTRSYRDRVGYGNLISQAEFLVLGCLGVTNLDTGTPLLIS